jgi:hypothetical protein
VFFLISCSDKLDETFDFKNSFKYSEDVGHLKFIEKVNIDLNGKQCNLPIYKYEVITSFKGDLKTGDVIELQGDVDSYENMKKERISFISSTTADHTFSKDECDIKMFSEYKAISLTCCVIETNLETTKKEVIFFKMITSERRGPPIPIDLETVYVKLEKYGD